MDRESRDLARREQRTPKKSASPKKASTLRTVNHADESVWLPESEKENGGGGGGVGRGGNGRTRLNFRDGPDHQGNGDGGGGSSGNGQAGRYGHPVFQEISRKNGFINRQDLSTLKRLCKLEEIDSAGKRDMIIKRLKQFYNAKLLKEAGLADHNTYRGFDYVVVVDFEATCEEKNSVDYPHEIIEFPAVLIDVLSCKIVESWRRYVRPVINPTLSEFCVTLTGISQDTVDSSDTFPTVLRAFQDWLTSKRLGSEFTFALVTDGPFDVGRFLRLSCEQSSLRVPAWASRWINLRKIFANFYKTHQANSNRSPGLQVMLSKLDLDFLGSPHSGLDDALNIARVVQQLIRDGAVLRVNERLHVPGTACQMEEEKNNSSKERRLPFVTAVVKKEADDWLVKCRRKLEVHPAADGLPLDDIGGALGSSLESLSVK